VFQTRPYPAEFDKERKLRMKSVVYGLAAFGIAILLTGCAKQNGPWPSDFDNRAFALAIGYRSIDQAADTFGVRSARVGLVGYRFNRPGDDWNSSFGFGFPDTLWLDLNRSDTGLHTVSGEMQRFTGYQLRCGGDTTRFSSLDSLAGWQMYLESGRSSILFSTGESDPTGIAGLVSVPDTVRASGGLELDLTFDWNGLFEVDCGPAATHVSINPAKISARQ
jgi:hypothetical protein